MRQERRHHRETRWGAPVDKFLTVKKRKPTVSNIRGSLALASLVNPAIASNKTIRIKKSNNIWSSNFSFSSPQASSFLPTNSSTTDNGRFSVSSPIASSSTFIDLSVDSESDDPAEPGTHASTSSPLPPCSAFSSDAPITTDSDALIINVSTDDDSDSAKKSLRAGRVFRVNVYYYKEVRLITLLFVVRKTNGNKDNTQPECFRLSWDSRTMFELEQYAAILERHGINPNGNLQIYEPNAKLFVDFNVRCYMRFSLAKDEPLIIADMAVKRFPGLTELTEHVEMAVLKKDMEMELKKTNKRRLEASEKELMGRKRLRIEYAISFYCFSDLTDNCMIDKRGLCCLVRAYANEGGLMRAYATTSNGL